jgi:L-ribulose-5-phosphate 4-epimerase
VASHGPFAWGKTVAEAVHHAVVLEHLVRLAGETLRIFPSVQPMQRVLMEKHFYRKHGPGAYYGQGPAAKTNGQQRAGARGVK